MTSAHIQTTSENHQKMKHITENLVLTSSAIYIKIISGTIALSPRHFSQATRATLMTPAKTND
jgi:hypothetical protein